MVSKVAADARGSCSKENFEIGPKIYAKMRKFAQEFGVPNSTNMWVDSIFRDIQLITAKYKNIDFFCGIWQHCAPIFLTEFFKIEVIHLQGDPNQKLQFQMAVTP